MAERAQVFCLFFCSEHPFFADQAFDKGDIRQVYHYFFVT